MHLGNRIEVDANAIALTWAPKLIGFFQLFLGDQAAAETLTVETLLEEARARSSLHEEDLPLGLLCRALKKAEWASAPGVTSTDPIIRAVSALPQSQRAAVALWRGMSFDFKLIARVMACNVSEVKRLLLDALLTLHPSLQPPDQTVRTQNAAGELK